MPAAKKEFDIEITEVSFRRKFNLGNYETEDIELTATVRPGQDPADVLKALDKATVEYRSLQKR